MAPIMIEDERTIRGEAEAEPRLGREEMIRWLAETDDRALEDLFARAYSVKRRYVGPVVYFRGIIEFSNLCVKDCFYCGIRKGNLKVERFQMTHEEIVESAVWAWGAGYGSIVLQSGERRDPAFVDFVEEVVRGIRTATKGELGMTLCLGEQSVETYRRWFAAGAHRYLLRIETSNARLYRRLHPRDHDYGVRRTCLDALRTIGYQVGTGVMIGLPFQTLEDLADDVLFFEELGVDMIGMGPYILHKDTPLAGDGPAFDRERQFRLGRVMIALCRIHLRDVNIAATTALQALHPQGRELGLLAGANIIMPNITHTRYRRFYQLYDDKPCLEEDSAMCRGCLAGRVAAVGERIGYRQWGDAPHFFVRKRKERIRGRSQ